jgi:hypothetical protein
MYEVASITSSLDSGWTPVVLLDVSANVITFASSRQMSTGSVHSLRFTLPGRARLHFVSVGLLASTTVGGPSGFRYRAEFLAIDPLTIDHVARFLSERSSDP